MCTVSIEVNEKMIKEVLPELESASAIRLWAQMLIDEHIKALAEGNETMDLGDACAMMHRAISREYALGQDMTPEQLYAVISEEIDDIYANG